MAEVNFKVGDKVIIREGYYHMFNGNSIGKIIGNILTGNAFYVESKDHHHKIVKKGELLTQVIFNNDLKLNKMTITKQEMKNAVEKVSNFLMTRDSNITTLPLKEELRNQYPAVLWNQYKTGVVDGVSDLFHELVREGKFKSIKNNGTYQTYVPMDWTKASALKKVLSSLTAISKVFPIKTPAVVVSIGARKISKVKLPNISRTKALDLIKNSKGQFIKVEFIKKDGTNRVLNGQYSAAIQPTIGLGLVTLRESIKAKLTPKDSLRQFDINSLKTLRVRGESYNIK